MGRKPLPAATLFSRQGTTHHSHLLVPLRVGSFFLEKNNTGVIVSSGQKEQRFDVKKHTLKSITVNIDTLGWRKFMKCC